LFFFFYAGVHTYHRTKNERISLELGTQRPELSHGSTDPTLPATRVMVKFFEDIDIRKAPAPFHYCLFLVRLFVWAFVLVHSRYNEITSLAVLTCMNATYLMWMMYVRPYKTNLNNRIGIFVETCTLLTTLCIFPYIRGWPPKDIFIDFAKYQFAIVWIMVLTIPVLLVGQHVWKVIIMKEDYYNKPHRTFFISKKKPKKIPQPVIQEVSDDGEGEGEGEEEKEPVEEKKEIVEAPPSVTSSFVSEGEDSEYSKSYTEGEGQSETSRAQESSIEESKEAPSILYEKPEGGDDGIDMNIIASDVNVANFETGADFDGQYTKNASRF